MNKLNFKRFVLKNGLLFFLIFAGCSGLHMEVHGIGGFKPRFKSAPKASSSRLKKFFDSVSKKKKINTTNEKNETEMEDEEENDGIDIGEENKKGKKANSNDEPEKNQTYDGDGEDDEGGDGVFNDDDLSEFETDDDDFDKALPKAKVNLAKRKATSGKVKDGYGNFKGFDDLESLSQAKQWDTLTKDSYLKEAAKYFKENGLGSTSDKDVMILRYRDVETSHKSARGSNVQVGHIYFSPTYLKKKYFSNFGKVFDKLSFEVEDTKGNKYVCKSSKHVKGPFSSGDYMVCDIYAGNMGDIIEKSSDIEVSPSFQLKKGKEYIVRLYSNEKQVDDKKKDEKNGASSEIPEAKPAAETKSETDVKPAADAKPTVKQTLIAEVNVVADKDSMASEAFDVDGGLARTASSPLFKQFAHPGSFFSKFYTENYGKIIDKVLGEGVL